MNTPLHKRLNKIVDLQIPGFTRNVPIGTVGQNAFADHLSIEWYEEFRQKIFGAIGKKFFPVFRASDGEFYFSVGFRPPYPHNNKKAIFHYVRKYLGALRVGRYPWRFRSGSPNYGWEEFSFLEWFVLRNEFSKYMHNIAENGIVAINFSITTPPFAEQYFVPFCNWLDSKKINIDVNNYYPFYFVYGLLNGPDSKQIYMGKNILVVTSFDEQKKNKLYNAIISRGARSVQFLPVTRNKALKDSIDISKLSTAIDVALVAAGVGASKVLCDLKELNCVCIDAGFCIDILLDETIREKRVFCDPDRT